MPKFLDAPSWYDETGTLRTLSGTVRFNSLAGFVDLPYTTFASGGARSSYYVLTSAGTNGNIAYSNGSYPMWLSNGTSGQVLMSNGNAAPSWGTLPFYLHRIYITGGTTGKFTINVYSMSSTTVSNNNVSGLVSFLRSANCTSIDTFFVANGVSFHTNTDARTVVGVYASSSNEYFYPVITQKDGSYDEGLETGKILSSSSGTIITEYVIEI